MGRRIVYGGLYAVVCLGLLILFLVKKLDKTVPAQVQGAIPEDAVLFAEEIDYKYLTESFLPESRIWIDFVNLIERAELDSSLNMVLGQLRSSESLNKLLLNKGLSLSLHMVGKDQLIPLFYLEYSSSHNDSDFEHMFMGLLENQAMVNERKYEGEKVYDVSGIPGNLPSPASTGCV